MNSTSLLTQCDRYFQVQYTQAGRGVCVYRNDFLSSWWMPSFIGCNYYVHRSKSVSLFVNFFIYRKGGSTEEKRAYRLTRASSQSPTVGLYWPGQGRTEPGLRGQMAALFSEIPVLLEKDTQLWGLRGAGWEVSCIVHAVLLSLFLRSCSRTGGNWRETVQPGTSHHDPRRECAVLSAHTVLERLRELHCSRLPLLMKPNWLLDSFLRLEHVGAACTGGLRPVVLQGMSSAVPTSQCALGTPEPAFQWAPGTWNASAMCQDWGRDPAAFLR